MLNVVDMGVIRLENGLQRKSFTSDCIATGIVNDFMHVPLFQLYKALLLYALLHICPHTEPTLPLVAMNIWHGDVL